MTTPPTPNAEAMPNGDWYCPNCGYLSPQRVTHSETCDECHQPVEFHEVETRTIVERLESQLAEQQARAERAEAECERMREYLDIIANFVPVADIDEHTVGINEGQGMAASTARECLAFPTPPTATPTHTAEAEKE